MKCVLLALMAAEVVAAESVCRAGVDLMFVQDTTGSFQDDLPIVLQQIPKLVNEVNAKYPHSHFGVAEFKDKPYFPLGQDHEEFCYKLGDGKLSPDLSDFSWAYSLLYASGGGDLPEASFQALIDVALDKKVGWRTLTQGDQPEDGEAAAHVVVLVTDAPMHLPGDIEKYKQLYPGEYPDLPEMTLPVNSGGIAYQDAIDYECLYEDYPDPYQVVDALKSKNIYLIILTPDISNITAGWHWFNEDALGQPADFYQFIQEDSSDLIDITLTTLDKVTAFACPTLPPGESTEKLTEAETMLSLLPPPPTTTTPRPTTRPPPPPTTTTPRPTTTTSPPATTPPPPTTTPPPSPTTTPPPPPTTTTPRPTTTPSPPPTTTTPRPTTTPPPTTTTPPPPPTTTTPRPTTTPPPPPPPPPTTTTPPPPPTTTTPPFTTAAPQPTTTPPPVVTTTPPPVITTTPDPPVITTTPDPSTEASDPGCNCPQCPCGPAVLIKVGNEPRRVVVDIDN